MAHEQTSEARRPVWMRRRYWATMLAVLAGWVIAFWLFGRFEQYLIDTPRFVLAGPPEPGEEIPGFAIDGAEHASRDRIRQAFGRDFGRSVYLLPIAERRRNLLAVNWVEDAAVSRIWPNSVRVRIRERKPVAFIQFAAAERRSAEPPPLRHALVDRDGFVLYPQAPARFELPVVLGITPSQSDADRRHRMRRVMRLLDELGPLGEAISEIDAADPDNLRVTQQVDDRAVTLILGNQRFRARMQNFLANYPEIRRRLPEASLLDLRLEDRITAVPQPPEAEGGTRGR